MSLDKNVKIWLQKNVKDKIYINDILNDDNNDLCQLTNKCHIDNLFNQLISHPANNNIITPSMKPEFYKFCYKYR